MSKKKKTDSKKDLKKSLGAARRELVKSETKLKKTKAKADRWKAEAAEQHQATARAVRRTEKLQARLERLQEAESTPAPAPVEPLTMVPPISEPAQDSAVPAVTSATPDETWTVAALRAEVGRRGLTGMSRKPKAELIRALT